MAYFDEAVQRFDDKLSLYNLLHIYIFEDKTKGRINESVELLERSVKQGFEPALTLLCIALLIKHNHNIENIFNDLHEQADQSNDLPNTIMQHILDNKLGDKSIFEERYQYYKTNDYLYNFCHDEVSTKSINISTQNNERNPEAQNISRDFYNSFFANY